MLPYACQIVKGCLEFFSKLFYKKKYDANYFSAKFPLMGLWKDDLDFIENEYGERAKNTLTDYSTLLYSLLQENDWEQEYKWNF